MQCKNATSFGRLSLLQAAVLAALGACPPVVLAAKANKAKIVKIAGVRKAAHARIAKAPALTARGGTPVATIGRALIDQDALSGNAQTILNRVPGTNVTSTNPLGVRPHISVRGFSQTQLGYTYDGIPIGDLFNGGLTGGNNNYASLYNLEPVTLGEISAIHVLYGPAPPDVNSVGGLGGTIAYVPRMPGTKFAASVFGGYGSFGTSNYGVSVNSGTMGDGGRLYVRASHRHTNNYLEGSPDSSHSFYGSYVLPEKNGHSVFSAIVLLNRNSGYIPARMPVPMIDQYGPDVQWPASFTYSYGRATHEMAILGYKDFMSRRVIFDTKAFYAYTRSNQLTYQNPSVTPTYDGNITYYPFGSGAPYNQYLYVTRTGGVSEDLNLLFGRARLTIGALGAASLYHSSQYWLSTPGGASIPGQNDAWDEHAYRTYGKFFAQARLRWGGLTVLPGVKEEAVDTNINDIPGAYYPVGAASGNTYSKPTPYLGLTYRVNKGWRVYGSAAQAYKFPNISAYYAADSTATATTPPQPITVVPEKVTSYQVGVHFANRGMMFGAALYRAYFTHTFSSVYDATNGLTYEYNYGSSRYTGLDLTGGYHLTRGLKIYGAYSLQSAQYTSNATNSFGSSVVAGEPRQYTPTYLANVGLADHWRHLVSSLWVSFVGSQYIGNSAGGVTGTGMPAYKTLNASFTYTMPVDSLGIKAIMASLNIDNILNSHALVYEKQFAYPNGPGNYNEGEPMMPRFVGLQLKALFGA